MRAKNRIWGFIVLGIFIIPFSISLINGNKNTNSLKKNSILAVGTVAHFQWYRGNSGASIDYLFNVDEVVYNAKSRLSVSVGEAKYLRCLIMNRQFPCVYERGNPSNSRILLLKEDYEEFNVKIPDTLVKIIDFLDGLSGGKAIYDSSYNPCKYNR